jgi:hypothetical protein
MWVGKLSDWPTHSNDCVVEKTKKMQKSCALIFEREVSKAQHHMEASTANAMKKMRVSLDSMLETGNLQAKLAKHSGARLDTEMKKVKNFIDLTLMVEVSTMQRSFDAVLDGEIKKMQTSLARKLMSHHGLGELTTDLDLAFPASAFGELTNDLDLLFPAAAGFRYE